MRIHNVHSPVSVEGWMFHFFVITIPCVMNKNYIPSSDSTLKSDESILHHMIKNCFSILATISIEPTCLRLLSQTFKESLACRSQKI